MTQSLPPHCPLLCKCLALLTSGVDTVHLNIEPSDVFFSLPAAGWEESSLMQLVLTEYCGSQPRFAGPRF